MTTKSQSVKTDQQAQIDADKRLKFMADSMPQLVWITSPDGHTEYYNQRWYDFTGTKPGSYQGDAWSKLFHPDDQARSVERWQHSLDTGEQFEIEYRLYHQPTDSYKWVIGRAKPFYENDSKLITKWYGTCTDIDEQKRNEQRQQFLSETSRVITSSLDYEMTVNKVSSLCVPDIADWCTVDLYDEENGFTRISMAHVDPEKLRLAKEYMKKYPIDINEPTGAAGVVKSGRTEFAPKIDPELIKSAPIDDDQREFLLSLNIKSYIIAPINIADTTIGAISLVSSESGNEYNHEDVKMAEDLGARIAMSIHNSRLYTEAHNELSRRNALEKELLIEKQKLESRVKERTEQLHLTNQGLRDEITKRRAAEEELIRSNKELEDFAYVASHDLQEPLRKIQAFGDLLETEYKDELGDGNDYLDRIRAASSRMSKLIQDLLTFSRIATKTNPPEPVDLNGILVEVVDDLESRITDTNGKVDVAELPIVMADPTHMRQLFQNLIGNALKFHRSDTAPIVQIEQHAGDENHFEIRVCDNGIGFDEKYLDRIFSVFQRLHGREEYEGTGIGLAVCRKIVEQYDGTITAETKKNNGSTFIITLPKHVAIGSIKEK